MRVRQDVSVGADENAGALAAGLVLKAEVFLALAVLLIELFRVGLAAEEILEEVLKALVLALPLFFLRAGRLDKDHRRAEIFRHINERGLRDHVRQAVRRVVDCRACLLWLRPDRGLSTSDSQPQYKTGGHKAYRGQQTGRFCPRRHHSSSWERSLAVPQICAAYRLRRRRHQKVDGETPSITA